MALAGGGGQFADVHRMLYRAVPNVAATWNVLQHVPLWAAQEYEAQMSAARAKMGAADRATDSMMHEMRTQVCVRACVPVCVRARVRARVRVCACSTMRAAARAARAHRGAETAARTARRAHSRRPRHPTHRHHTPNSLLMHAHTSLNLLSHDRRLRHEASGTALLLMGLAVRAELSRRESRLSEEAAAAQQLRHETEQLRFDLNRRVRVSALPWARIAHARVREPSHAKSCCLAGCTAG